MELEWTLPEWTSRAGQLVHAAGSGGTDGRVTVNPSLLVLEAHKSPEVPGWGDDDELMLNVLRCHETY